MSPCINESNTNKIINVKMSTLGGIYLPSVSGLSTHVLFYLFLFDNMSVTGVNMPDDAKCYYT